MYIGFILFIGIGILIYFREYLESDELNFKDEDKYITYLSLLITFLLGSFTSFVFVYYIRGSEIVSNIPILVLILSLMLSNEFIKNKYRLYVDLASYSLSTIFFFIFAVPYILNTLNDFTFIISLILVGVILYFYLLGIYRVNLHIFKFKIQNYIFVPLILIFVLYFSNIFPAVPLSLNSSSLYKKILVENINTNNISQKKYTKESEILRNIFLKRVVNKSDTNILYYYSELQAPTNLNTKASHVWEYYDSKNGKWIVVNNISFNLKGGRTDGYRAYSYITNINIGEYRVKVLVDDKRLAGKLTFEVR
jgi:ABC-type multidrug transport system fused ATPase/permease subunit